MQKVVIISVNSSVTLNERLISHDVKEINDLLAEGYRIVQFHQISSSDNLYCATYTFILEIN
jgi:hypothetical protein